MKDKLICRLNVNLLLIGTLRV